MLVGAHSLSETLTYCIGNGSKGGLTRCHSLGCVGPSGHRRPGVACDWEPRLNGRTGCRHLQDNEDRRHYCAGSWAVPNVRFCPSGLGHPLRDACLGTTLCRWREGLDLVPRSPTTPLWGGGRSLRSIRTSPGELTRPLGAGPSLPIARWPRAPGCVRVGTATLGKATITKGDLSEIRVSEVPGESCSGHHDYCTGTRAVGQPCL